MKFKIEANISEKHFMESILNMYFSGVNPELTLVFYALAHSWHIDKLLYYKSLMMRRQTNDKTL